MCRQAFDLRIGFPSFRCCFVCFSAISFFWYLALLLCGGSIPFPLGSRSFSRIGHFLSLITGLLAVSRIRLLEWVRRNCVSSRRLLPGGLRSSPYLGSSPYAVPPLALLHPLSDGRPVSDPPRLRVSVSSGLFFDVVSVVRRCWILSYLRAYSATPETTSWSRLPVSL